MKRLIDADWFRRYMHEQFPDGVKFSADDVLELIDEQPTAYDVEKVVEQLKMAKKTALDKVRMIFLIVTKRDLQEFVNICFDEAIMIVRKGGVE